MAASSWGETRSFLLGLSSMKCSHCLCGRPPRATRNFLPWYFAPLRLVVGCARCNSCLTYFYRIRLLGILIPAGTSLGRPL
jgi:hypothetical protein